MVRYLTAALLCTGCTGALDVTGDPSTADRPSSNVDGGITNEAGEPVACTASTSTGAPVPLRRLNAAHVTHTVLSVFGIEQPLEVSDEQLATIYRSNISSAVDSSSARAFLDYAESVSNKLDASDCAAVDCRAWTLDVVARQLLRRPLQPSQRQLYEGLYDAGLAAGDETTALRWTVQALLQSPSFLYLDEPVDAAGYLDNFAIASRLAMVLWAANPDANLLDVAARGELSSAEQVRAQAAQMLDDPRARVGLREFVDQWLHLEKLHDVDTRPDLTALGETTLGAMREEPVTLVHTLVEREAGLASLLRVSEVPAEPSLRETYGADIVEERDGLFVLNPDVRAGILTLPGVMAALAHAEVTSPTVRGHMVLGSFLCTPPSPPPPGLDVTLPEPEEGKTLRQRMEAHFNDDSCSGCHMDMDGIGFSFERIDWLGRSRSTDNGLPLDTSGDFTLGGTVVHVEDAIDLAEHMSTSEVVAQCVAKQWLRYAVGVKEDAAAECTIEQMQLEAGSSLREMILTLVSSDWFRKGRAL